MDSAGPFVGLLARDQPEGLASAAEAIRQSVEIEIAAHRVCRVARPIPCIIPAPPCLSAPAASGSNADKSVAIRLLAPICSRASSVISAGSAESERGTRPAVWKGMTRLPTLYALLSGLVAASAVA